MLNTNKLFIKKNAINEFILLVLFGLLILNIFCSLLAIEIPFIYIHIVAGIFFIFLYSKLFFSEIFVSAYYFLLIVSYFIVGYFGVYSFSYFPNLSLFYARISVAFLHFLPIFVVISLTLHYQRFRKMLLYDYFGIIFFVFYVLVINFLHQNFGMQLIVQIRNFFELFAAFLWGAYVSSKINFKYFYKSIVLIALVVIFFGLFEYFFKYDFWINYFPSYFVALIKKSGTFENGLIGNKAVGIGGKVFFRMSSFFYEPKFAGYNFVFYFLFLVALLKEKLIKLRPILLCYLLCFIFLICIMLTFVKSAWGVLVNSLIILIFLKIVGVNKVRKHPLIWTSITILLGLFSGIGLILFFIKFLGITSTTMAHVQATLEVFQFSPKELLFGKKCEEFDILNSDSGFATIIFSIGFIGYILFTFGIIKILKEVIKNSDFIFLRLIMFSLIIAWFIVLHFKSDVWSPLGNFIIFFTAGLVSNLKIRNYYGRNGAIYRYPYRYRS